MRLVAVDTNIFIYHLQSHSIFGNPAQELFHQIERGQIKALASMISLSEILVLPARIKDSELVQRYKEMFLRFPHLQFVSLDAAIAEKAASIRGAHSHLKLMDAIILATAIEKKATCLVTEDTKMKKLSLTLQVKTLDEFL